MDTGDEELPATDPLLEQLRNQAIRSELEQVLQDDDSLLGEVYRRTEAGESAEQIRIARGAQRPNFVWNYLQTIRVLLEGELPTAPSLARGNTRRLRSILKQKELSEPARTELEHRLVILEERVTDPTAKRIEDQQAVEATTEAEQQALPGVYVYVLPHYVRHPYDEDSGRTLMKVGRADRSVIRRFREQTRTTALPEDPVLLRIYPCAQNESMVLERRFHSLLEAADHDRSQARTGGTEWFLTSLKFLDEIASTLDLDVRTVTELGEVVD